MVDLDSINEILRLAYEFLAIEKISLCLLFPEGLYKEKKIKKKSEKIFQMKWIKIYK